MKKIWHFLDENLLFIWSVILLVFIPLYPKIPLADILPGYIVRLRLEDILVAVGVVLWGVWWLRGKVKFNFPIRYLILSFLGVGLLSVLWNILISGWIPMTPVHMGKSFLHLARYAEYFFVGFLVYSSCNTLKKFKIVLGAIFGTLLAISIYAIGQKYFYWPVFSTMNREFSKGVVLYLTKHARVQSTFGGHYDFAAYLVMVLPITLALVPAIKKWWWKLMALIVHFMGVWCLIVSASRTSFGAYMVVIALGILIYSWSRPVGVKIGEKIKKWWQNLGLMMGLGLGYLVIVLGLILFFGDDLAERLVHPFRNNETIVNSYNNFVRWRDEDGKIKSFLAKFNPPESGQPVTLDDQTMVVVKSDELPTSKPVDVYVDVPDIQLVATETATGSVIVATETARTWSDNAQKYGLSVGIRLDALWPWAIKGLLRNPVLGSGFGTLNKDVAELFTEADSTDNNYLRLLGETGLLGFMIYMGMLVWTLMIAMKMWRKAENVWVRTFNLGIFIGLIGLMINATFIDVFASSKVAFTLWMMVALVFDAKDEFNLVEVNKKSWKQMKKNKLKNKEQLVQIELKKGHEKKVEKTEIPEEVKAQIKDSNELKIANVDKIVKSNRKKVITITNSAKANSKKIKKENSAKLVKVGGRTLKKKQQKKQLGK